MEQACAKAVLCINSKLLLLHLIGMKMLFKRKHLFFFHSPKSLLNPKMGETFWPPVKSRNFLPAFNLQHGSLEVLNKLFLLLCWNSHWSWYYQHSCRAPARNVVKVMQFGVRGEGREGQGKKVALPEQWLCLLWSLCSPERHSVVTWAWLWD